MIFGDTLALHAAGHTMAGIAVRLHVSQALVVSILEGEGLLDRCPRCGILGHGRCDECAFVAARGRYSTVEEMLDWQTEVRV